MTKRLPDSARRSLVSAALSIALGLLAGCWYPALQLAPVALQATEAVGMGAASLASKSSSNSDKGEDDLDRRERCDDLEDAPPNIIELRTPDASQSPQWRELRIDDSTGEPRWESTVESDDASTWRPAENLLKMNFQPPLGPLLNPRSSLFLIYAPAEPQTAEEANQLDGLVAEFGSGAGTFHWNTRIYQYALVTRLPCFPLSTAAR